MMVDRVIAHQRWLWERALARELYPSQIDELKRLRTLLLKRKVWLAGRTMFLGGTPISKRVESTQFNCAFREIRTISDVVDCFWLLLQGCGVGFNPISGYINGFNRPMDIRVIPSTRTAKGGCEDTVESYDGMEWRLAFGDSAKAWALGIGKLLERKWSASRLILDFSAIRPAGEYLSNYGWIGSGYAPLANAMVKIAEIMNRMSRTLLSSIDILEIMNLLGTTLSSRRSAEICLLPSNHTLVNQFTRWKNEKTINDPATFHCQQSNNSIIQYGRPTYYDTRNFFRVMQENGGAEPGLINAHEASRRAPWFRGVNPCGEILLADGGFCNLVTLDLGKYETNAPDLFEDIALLARANYRQTCVNLRDGILQSVWHENNDYLRLCGVSLCGIVRRMGTDFKALRKAAKMGADSMADQLKLPRPCNVTTVKPEGTASKVLDTTEGAHRPLGKYVINNVSFSEHNPLIPALIQAGYSVRPNPVDTTAVLVALPIQPFDDVDYTNVNGIEVDCESIHSQLDRYSLLMREWCDQNVSYTVYWDKEEDLDYAARWVSDHWHTEDFVGLSFLKRPNPFRSAKDLGFPYLPQEVVTKASFLEYQARLKPITITSESAVVLTSEEMETLKSEGCSGGVCPSR
jgi:ribonucleoside-triphosphate reductase (formate)